MQSARVVFLVILFALAAVAAHAETYVTTQTCPTIVETPVPVVPGPTCPTIETPAPVGAGPACPTPCPAQPACPSCNIPEPVCQPCAEAVAPAPVMQPCGACGMGTTCAPVCGAAIPITPSCALVAGAGPAAALNAACAGPDFDRAYIEGMYSLHSAVIALTSQGIEQVTDRNLRDLSIKIRDEQTAQNTKLAMWYRDMGCGPLKTDFCNPMIECLSKLSGPQYDLVYAQTLSDMLAQLRDGGQVGVSKLTDPAIRNQAGLVVKTTNLEITALQNWIAAHGMARTTY